MRLTQAFSIFVLTFLFIGCADDPILKGLEKEDDHEEKYEREITIANETDQAIKLCSNYGSDCQPEIAPGETETRTVSNYDWRSSEQKERGEELSISLIIKSETIKQRFKASKSYDQLFRTAGAEVRWLGNFSGVHSLIVSKDLATAFDGLAQNKYWLGSDETKSVGIALNNLDHAMSYNIGYYDFLKITPPAEDHQVFLGTEPTSQPDEVVSAKEMIVDGWRYTALEAEMSDVMFSNYTKASKFVCRVGGCFAEE